MFKMKPQSNQMRNHMIYLSMYNNISLYVGYYFAPFTRGDICGLHSPVEWELIGNRMM